MDVQLLTQYLVRQTTVLLAQLSTAAGVRAPLAHIADQVRGQNAVFGLTSESERERLRRAESIASLANLVWLCLATQGSKSRSELGQLFASDAETLTEAVARLIADGRVTQRDEHFAAESFEIPVGAEEGWEAAVCDHFRAVATAIGAKIATRGSRADDTVGGATLCFTVHAGHPRRAEVFDLLRRVRGEIGPLWNDVADWNREHPPPADADRVTFYFGQNVTTRAPEPSPEQESNLESQ